MKTAMNFITVAFAVLITFSCTKEASVESVTDPGKPTAAVPTTVNKTLMLQMINEVRQKGCQCGDTYYYSTTPLLWNDLLEKAAYLHSSDMYTHDYFSHTSLDGSRAGDRIDAAGYKWMSYGENIGSGYHTEKEVVEAWLKSTEHCKNIMGRNFKEMGVARVGNYWTQEFASK